MLNELCFEWSVATRLYNLMREAIQETNMWIDLFCNNFLVLMRMNETYAMDEECARWILFGGINRRSFIKKNQSQRSCRTICSRWSSCTLRPFRLAADETKQRLPNDTSYYCNGMVSSLLQMLVIFWKYPSNIMIYIWTCEFSKYCQNWKYCVRIVMRP